MNNKYMFSIILPIYKVEKYLKNCIDSILKQTFKEYEIILVDDGSPDSCGSICDEYSKRFDFIKTIHKENGGLSDARNVGLKHSQGEYVIFLDSDDFWIDNEFLENISKTIFNKDLIIFNSVKYYNNSKIIGPRFSISNDFKKLTDAEKKEYVIKNNIYKACAWDKVIKRSVLIDNKIKFPVKKLSEDMHWAGELIEFVDNIDIYDTVVYAYRQREGSISKTVSEKHINDILYQIENGVLKKDNIILNYYSFEYCVLLAYMKNMSPKNKERAKQLAWLLNYDLNKKVLIVKLIYKIFGFDITCKLLNLYINR